VNDRKILGLIRFYIYERKMSNNESFSTRKVMNSTNLRQKLILVHSINNLLFNKCRFKGSKKLGRLISKIFLPPITKPILCPTIFNFDLYLSKNNGKEIYNIGFYEIGTLEIIKQCLRQGDIFVDVGSSIGLMTFTASYSVGDDGKVLAFEPDPERFCHLQNSILENKRMNIKAFNVGLGDQRKKEKLYRDRMSPSMIKTEDSVDFERVKVEVLDQILAKENIPLVNFLKIDVEGYEMSVLKGTRKCLSSPKAPIICIEYSFDFIDKNNCSEDIFDFIKVLNKYSYYQLIKTSHTISKLKPIRSKSDLNKHDNLYCFLEHHLEYVPMDLFLGHHPRC